MNKQADNQDLDAAPVEGKITDEAVAAARKMIGMQLRPEGPYLQDATLDTIRSFCNGIGDLKYTGIGHHRESIAKEVGVPGTYDYGPHTTTVRSARHGSRA
jgi:hypothetical protein